MANQESVQEQEEVRARIAAGKKNNNEAPKPKLVKPHEPENLHLSRDEYERQQRIKAEKRAKVEAYKKQLDAEGEIAIGKMEDESTPVPAVQEEPKPQRGRPKKILD